MLALPAEGRWLRRGRGGIRAGRSEHDQARVCELAIAQLARVRRDALIQHLQDVLRVPSVQFAHADRGSGHGQAYVPKHARGLGKVGKESFLASPVHLRRTLYVLLDGGALLTDGTFAGQEIDLVRLGWIIVG